jgi:hypothetical protein
MKKLATILEKEKFIGERHIRAIDEKIQSFENDPCFGYFNFLSYLRHAPDQ